MGFNVSNNSTSSLGLLECTSMTVVLAGILGNSFILLVLVIKRRSTKIPDPINVALCSLLVVDVIFLILSLWDDLFYDLTDSALTQLSEFACFALAVALSTLPTLQGYLQCVISFERVLTIFVPLKVKLMVTRVRISVAIGILSVVVLSLRVAYAVIGYEFTDESRCYFRQGKENQMLFLGVFDSVLLCAVPSIVLLSYTCCIIGLLVRYRRQSSTESRPRLSGADIKLSLILVVMNVLFVCTSLPYNVDLYSHLIEIGGVEEFIPNYHKLSVRLTRLAASTDWLVIVSLSRGVRDAAKKMRCRRRHRF